MYLQKTSLKKLKLEIKIHAISCPDHPAFFIHFVFKRMHTRLALKTPVSKSVSTSLLGRKPSDRRPFFSYSLSLIFLHKMQEIL